jgi:hypothetical protein
MTRSSLTLTAPHRLYRPTKEKAIKHYKEPQLKALSASIALRAFNFKTIPPGEFEDGYDRLPDRLDKRD